FDAIWIDCLNGDSRETGKLTPTGLPDPSVFSTRYNRAGIRVGTAVGVFVRRGQGTKKVDVRYRDFWGTTKREDLLQSLNAKNFDDQYTAVNPQPINKFSLHPSQIQAHYLSWPKLPDMAELPPINGLMEKRSNALISIDQVDLISRIKSYFDESIDWNSYS